MDEEMLVRTWSADALYSPGAQSDEMVTFNADGTGFFEQLNWGYGSVFGFRWTLRSGILTIESCGSFEIGEDDELGPITPFGGKYETADASVTVEVLPVRGRSEVLRLPGFAESFDGVEFEVFGFDPGLRKPSYNFPFGVTGSGP